MACIQQEIQDLKVQLDVEGRQKHSSKDQKTMKRIEALKEQFRELLVGMTLQCGVAIGFISTYTISRMLWAA
jgi:hypothetical protein